MKKKLVSLAVAAMMIASLSVSIFAAEGQGQSHTVTGNGNIGIGSIVNPGDNETSAPPTIDAVEDEDTEITGTGIGGSDIRVRFADGTTANTVVANNGLWSVNVPAGVTLVEGENVYAAQHETRTYTDENGDVQRVNWSDEIYAVIGSGEGGGIVNPGNPDDYLNLIVPATFAWAVNETSAPGIIATTQKIENLSTTIDGVEYGSTVNVTLNSFRRTGGAAISSSDLTLKLTGALALPSDANLADDMTTAHTYATKLTTGDIWNFSFDGSYTGNIPSDALQPTYEMVLHFAVENVEQI